MAIQQLQLPTYAQPQTIDFQTPLANLGKMWGDTQDAENRQRTMAAISDQLRTQGKVTDWSPLLSNTDPSLIKLGQTMMQSQTENEAAAQRARLDAFKSTPEYLMAAAKAKAAGEDAGGPATGLQVLYGQNDKGDTVPLQPNKAGKLIASELPPGVTLNAKPITVNTPQSAIIYDPTQRRIVQTITKDTGGTEYDRKNADELVKLETGMPRVQAAADLINHSLTGVENHPGKDSSFGVYGSYVPVIPGSDRANFKTRLDQLRGQTFLQAYETLRGAGQITEVEGAKGTDAIGRLQTSQSVESFNEALKDLRSVVSSAISRQQSRIGTLRGQVLRNRQGQAGPEQVSIDPRAVELLRTHPEAANDFDAKYGNGAAAAVLGQR